MEERPTFLAAAPGWYLLLDGGIVALAVLALSGGAHRRARRTVPLPPPSVLKWMLAATVAIHLGETAYTFRVARRRELPVLPWVAQTWMVGFASLRQLRRLPSTPVP